MRNLLFILIIPLFAACGVMEQTSKSELAATDSFDEYDPRSLTRVTSWSIDETFWFNSNLNGKAVLIKNVDAVQEIMQIYIGSGKRSRFHVYVLVDQDLGVITNRLSVVDRLQPHNLRTDKAYFMERDSSGGFVYRLSLPAVAPYRHEIYAELRGPGDTRWSNENSPNVFDLICYSKFRRN